MASKAHISMGSTQGPCACAGDLTDMSAVSSGTRCWSRPSRLWTSPGGSTLMLTMRWWRQQPTAKPWRQPRQLSATSSTALCTELLLHACTLWSASSQTQHWTALFSHNTTALLWTTCGPLAPLAAFRQLTRVLLISGVGAREQERVVLRSREREKLKWRWERVR